jgi:hypothetical protein
MILMGFKYRVEVYTGNTEIAEIRQFRLYACEVAAEVIVIPYMTVLIGLIVRSTAPVITQDTSLRYILVFLSAFAEAVREYLIHYAALEKIRGRKIAGINCKLKEFAAVESAFMAVYLFDIVAYTLFYI